MEYILYAHINKSNHKMYIGITSQIPEKRYRNGYGYKDSPKFWNAIREYGWDNFDHIVLLSGLTQEEAKKKKEIETIERYNTIANGYNISEGGDVPSILRGKDHPNYQSHFSDETRRKMSENHADFSGAKHPRARKVMCIETDKIYNTITEAAEDIHISRKCVNDTCIGRQNTAGGYHWKYYEL